MTTRWATGELLDQRFELVAPAPDRGLGDSWKAVDRRFKNRPVLVKFLRAVRGSELPEELADHVNALRSLKNPQVMAVVGHGVHGSVPFLVHEFFEGRSLGTGLDEARESGTLLPLVLLEALFAKVSAGVAAAHAQPRPVMHAGLNPGSVLVHRMPGEDFQVRVLDFGLRVWADADLSAPLRSARNLEYLAPEQRDGRPPTVQTDLFGLGALLREMVSTPPEVGATMTPTAAHRRREDVSPAVWDVAGVALHPDPAQRFESVEAFLAEVQRAWQQPLAPPPAPPAPPPRPAPAAAPAPPAWAPPAPSAWTPPAPPGPMPIPLPMPAGFAPPPVPAQMPVPRAPVDLSATTPGDVFSVRSGVVVRPIAPVQPVQDYAATMALTDLPADGNPWEVLPSAMLGAGRDRPRARSMADLLQSVQQGAASAAPPPRPRPSVDAAADLGATIVDDPPQEAAFGQTIALDAGLEVEALGPRRPQQTVPMEAVSQGAFAGGRSPDFAPDATMALGESPFARSESSPDSTMALGTSPLRRSEASPDATMALGASPFLARGAASPLDATQHLAGPRTAAQAPPLHPADATFLASAGVRPLAYAPPPQGPLAPLAPPTLAPPTLPADSDERRRGVIIAVVAMLFIAAVVVVVKLIFVG